MQRLFLAAVTAMALLGVSGTESQAQTGKNVSLVAVLDYVYTTDITPPIIVHFRGEETSDDSSWDLVGELWLPKQKVQVPAAGYYTHAADGTRTGMWIIHFPEGFSEYLPQLHMTLVDMTRPAGYVYFQNGGLLPGFYSSDELYGTGHTNVKP